MLNEFLFTRIEEEDIGHIWFQQDSATWHTAEADRAIDLQKMPILAKNTQMMEVAYSRTFIYSGN